MNTYHHNVGRVSIMSEDKDVATFLRHMEDLRGMPDAENGLAAMRAAYHEQFKRETSLSREEQLAIAASPDDDMGPEWYVARMVEAEAKPADQAPKDANAGTPFRPRNWAEMGDKLAGDAVLQRELNAFLEAAATVKRGPLDMLFHLERIYSKEELDAMPEPMSTSETVKGKNLPFDRYGEGLKDSYYADIASRLPEYKSIQDSKDALNAKKEVGGKSSDHDNVVRTFTARQQKIVSLLRDAKSLHDMAQAINNFPTCTVTFESVKDHVMSGDTKVEIKRAKRSGDPIKIMDSKAAEIKYYSVGTFLRLDIDKAKANGSNLEALVATTKRGKKTTAATSMPRIEKIETWNDHLVTMANFVDTAENRVKVLSSINDTKLKPDEKEHLVKTYLKVCSYFFDLEVALRPYRKAYEKADEKKEAEAAKALQKAAEQAAKNAA